MRFPAAVMQWLRQFWFFRKAELAVTIIVEKRVTRSAAELAYFLMLSFFPLLICLHAAVARAGLGPDELRSLTGGLLPPQAMEILLDYTTYVAETYSPALLAAGVFMLFGSSSAAFRALIDVMDEIFGQKRFHGLRHVVASVFFSAGMLATIYGCIALLVTGQWFLALVNSLLGTHGFFQGWLHMRFFILFLLLLLMISLFYRAVAPRGRRVPIWPGAVFAAVALLGVSLVFSAFIGYSSRYSLVYGSLTSIIVLLVWLYLCGNMVIIGNVVNFVLSQPDR